ncbi:MAG TPA: hypothetical protein VLT47_00625 [Anaeromyxobacteraceae bacterium]|nr:hypothetical protein [Anaeromyxobacteraceae bacterium]
MTSSAARLSSHIEELPEGSPRRRILEAARRYKASWVDLARLLVQVKRDEAWREWGHASFDRYCTAELFIRKQTAEKLLASFGFLERHEPALAKPRGEPRAPPFEVIEVLSRAEASGRLSESGWQELREEVLEQSPTPAVVNRRLTEKFGKPPAPPTPPRGERLERLAAAAGRLADACRAERAVPPAVAERAASLAEALGELAGGEG